MKTNQKLGMALQFALAAFAWGMATFTAVGQTLVTNGCVVITFPPNRTNIVCAAGWVVDDYAVGILDQCSGGTTSQIVVQCQPPPGTMIPVGVQEVYCRASTNGIIFASRPFLLVVESALPLPVVQSPPNQVIIAPCETNCVPVTYDPPVVTSGTLVECSPPSGACFPIGFNWVTCRATNDCGSSSSSYFSITITRESPLSIQCGSPGFAVFGPCESNCVPVTYPPPIVTNGTLISCAPPSGACFPKGHTTVVCRATNDCGDSLSCFFLIRVDSARPVILCPTNEINAFPPCHLNCAVVNYALPEVRGGTLIECTPPPGTCFPTAGPRGGTIAHRVTCRATNDCGGSASCAFNIRVSQDQFQFREPFFFPLAPRDVALTNQCGSSCVPTPAYQLPTLYYGWLDRCTPPSGTCLPVGTHQVICRATNTCGQQTSTGFYVRVVEGRPPPPTIRIVKEEDLHFLFWENECGTIGLLEAADEPDGPWETLPGAGPGYMVNPSKFKRYFRVIVPE